MKYSKIAVFIAAIILAYIIFSNSSIGNFISNLGGLGYAGAFIAGIFYTLGFTSPFSAGFFIDLNPANIWVMGILGGIGALIGDMLIFGFARMYFKDEFKKLGKEKIFKKLKIRLSNSIIYIVAAILIASPLPDEAGITLIAGLTKIRANIFAILGFILNTIGILILLSL
jgi:uncharacterized membrane protein YdjX (TVP38/TMEM64 family)